MITFYIKQYHTLIVGTVSYGSLTSALLSYARDLGRTRAHSMYIILHISIVAYTKC